MKHKDHLLLADYLIGKTPERLKNIVFRKAFLLGNVLPDYNPFTYLRGVRESRRMVGHNTVCSEKHILRVALRLQKNGVQSVIDHYSLGTVIHYLADSFTYPHTAAFHDKMKAHNRYEKELGNVFPECVKEAVLRDLPHPPRDIPSFLKSERKLYESRPCGIFTDTERILHVCASVYGSILQEKA